MLHLHFIWLQLERAQKGCATMYCIKVAYWTLTFETYKHWAKFGLTKLKRELIIDIFKWRIYIEKK